MKRHHPRGREAGAALLAIMLVIIVAASYVLVSKLNANVRQYTRQAETSTVLRDASKALLGYSVTYPDDPAHTSGGPGILPCPDLNNDGSASGNCSFPDTTMGRFPWKTVGVGEFRDHQGERLWYVVSDNFRTPVSGQINSDTPGTLNVNSSDDIVAVIFSPGTPVCSQDRTADPLAPTNYLEGGNETNDTNFVTRYSNPGADCNEFNDQLVFITRKELMTAVEKRVIGEVEKALNTYREDPDYDDVDGEDPDCPAAEPDCDNALPWLSVFSDPSSSSFKSIIGTYKGHIPYHWSSDTAGNSNRNPFETSVGWTWHTDPGTATGSFSGTVTADCLRNVDCDDGRYPPISSVNASSIDCVWSNKDSVDCEESGWVLMTTTSCSDYCGSGTCTREYRVRFPAYTGTSTVINSQTESNFRTRDIVRSGELAEQNSAVRIRDIYDPSHPVCLTVTTGEGVINFESWTTGSMGTHGIKYDIDIDSGELPEWFTENEWHEFIYVAYSDFENIPGGSDTVCDPDAGECITVEAVPGEHNNKRAVVLLAGRDFLGNRPTGSLSDYFEDDNANNDDVFTKSPVIDPTAQFNDKIRIVLETP